MTTFITILITFFIGFVLGASRERVLNQHKAEIDHLNGFIRQFKEEQSDELNALFILEWLKLNKFKILKK